METKMRDGGEETRTEFCSEDRGRQAAEPEGLDRPKPHAEAAEEMRRCQAREGGFRQMAQMTGMVRNDAPLSAEERQAWEALVAAGDELHKKRHAPAVEAHVANVAAKWGGAGSNWRKEWKRKQKRNLEAMDEPDPTPAAVRWMLARNGGLNPAAATAATGLTWGEYVVLRRDSLKVRRAELAMREGNRRLMAELAYGMTLDVLAGSREATPQEVRTAQWALERVEREEFGAKVESPEAVAKAVAGGITIALVDTSKPYVPPAVAAKGDGEEGVEV